MSGHQHSQFFRGHFWRQVSVLGPPEPRVRPAAVSCSACFLLTTPLPQPFSPTPPSPDLSRTLPEGCGGRAGAARGLHRPGVRPAAPHLPHAQLPLSCAAASATAQSCQHKAAIPDAFSGNVKVSHPSCYPPPSTLPGTPTPPANSFPLELRAGGSQACQALGGVGEQALGRLGPRPHGRPLTFHPRGKGAGVPTGDGCPQGPGDPCVTPASPPTPNPR